MRLLSAYVLSTGERIWLITEADRSSTTLLLHHTVKSGQDARGSGSLHGAADSMVFVQRQGSRLTVRNTKLKDEAEFSDMTFETKTIPLNELGTSSSLVLIPTDPLKEAEAIEAGMARRAARPALETLALASEPLQTQDWVALHSKKMGAPVSTNTFNKWRKALADEELIVATQTNPPRYSISQKGALAVGVPLARQSESHTPATPPPLGGGMDEREGGRKVM